MGERKEYMGVAETLEGALRVAHMKIPPRTGKDFTTSRVCDWGVQYGGFAERTRYWVKLVEDPDAPVYDDG